MIQTTLQNIRRGQLVALATVAVNDRDADMIETCSRALQGEEEAIQICVARIRAMESEEK
jgi:hypothetical protein